MINIFCFTTVPLVHYDLGRVGGSVTEKPPCDIFNRFDHYFQLNLDETSFLCNEGELNVLGRKEKSRHEKIAVNQGFK